MTKENTQLAEKQEQGIDQILSDIKDVITNNAPAQEEVLELTEVIQEVKAANESKPAPVSNIQAPEPTPAPIQQPVASNDILATLDGAATKTQPVQQNSFQDFKPAPHAQPANSGTMENLLDDAVAATSRQTLKNFMKMTEKNDIDTLKLRSGGTVEDIIIELIKPQLSDWLNKNLPALVTSVVEKEIKKLVPKDE
jgi:cell pole-organizing protein PopZ